MLRGGEDQLPVCLPVYGSVCVITVPPAVSFLAEDTCMLSGVFLVGQLVKLQGLIRNCVLYLSFALLFFFLLVQKHSPLGTVTV